MTHYFITPDGSTYAAEFCDIGLSESPINFYIPDKNSHIRLEIGSSGWYIMLCILDLVDEDTEHKLNEHEPIVGLVAALHWACMAESDAFGVVV